ncbi:sulfur carrier protein ThiS [Mariniflexile ostreae]|uniref:Sulfur carrier protein ThiS n=1 Tax=Mariniflexile ostreae TaxID=1520892 RepID=A0ABV5FBU0_9FLAO
MMLNVLVNDTPIEMEACANLHQLLQKLNTSSDGIAIAVNNEIISKSSWEQHRVKPNDSILIIKATQGG